MRTRRDRRKLERALDRAQTHQEQAYEPQTAMLKGIGEVQIYVARLGGTDAA